MNPPISEQFFHEHPLCPDFKNKNPPPNFRGGWGGGDYGLILKHCDKPLNQYKKNVSENRQCIFDLHDCSKNP